RRARQPHATALHTRTVPQPPARRPGHGAPGGHAHARLLRLGGSAPSPRDSLTRMDPQLFIWLVARTTGMASYAALCIALLSGLALPPSVRDWLAKNRPAPSLHGRPLL